MAEVIESTDSPKPKLHERVSQWLSSISGDLRVLIEIMGDKQVPLSASALATGVAFYVLSPVDLIPDKIPLVGYLDDIFVIRIGLEIILSLCPDERRQYYISKYPKTFEQFEEQIELVKSVLKGLYERLRPYVQKLTERRYKGMKAQEVPASEELREKVFDEVMERSVQLRNALVSTDQKLLPGAIERFLPLLEGGLDQNK